MNNLEYSISLLKIIKSVMKDVRRRMEKHFKDLNLTGPQMLVAITLIHNGKMKISDLSKKMNLSNSTISGIVDRMEKQGSVKRIRSKDDRRVVYVDVTSKFKKLTRCKHEEMGKMLQSIVDSATEEEMGVINKGLVTLQKVIDRQKMNRE